MFETYRHVRHLQSRNSLDHAVQDLVRALRNAQNHGVDPYNSVGKQTRVTRARRLHQENRS